MDALLTAFVCAFLAGWGDRAQLSVAALSTATRRPAHILAGLFLAALASNVVCALAGVYVAETIPIRAMTLMTAIALLFAGGSGLMRRKPPKAERIRWPFATAFILCLAAEVGDRTQLTTFALAGRFDSAPLAAAGATLGTLAACLPAAMLGNRFSASVPLRAIRYSVAALFLIAGFIVAVQALQLA